MSSAATSAQLRRDCPCRRLQQSSSSIATSAQTVSSKIERCDEESTSLCPVCVSRALRPLLEKQREAELERDKLRKWCASRLTEIRRDQSSDSNQNQPADGGDEARGCDDGTDLTRLRDETDRLHAQLGSLRQACSSAALNLAALVVQNDEREALVLKQRSVVDEAMGGLHRLSGALLCNTDDNNGGDGGNSGGLVGAIQSGTEEVRLLRFRFAIQSFEMHRLDIGPEYRDMIGVDVENQTTGQSSASPENRLRQRRFANKSPSGIGKIGGLPLPHAGPALYGVLPPEVLCSSLRLVASLTSTLARCLGIVLPHPIILRDDHNGKSESSKVSKSKSANYSLGANQNRDIIESSEDNINLLDDNDSDDEVTINDTLSIGCSDANENKQAPTTANPPSANPPPSASSSFMSLVGSLEIGRSARRALARVTTAANDVPSFSSFQDRQSDRVRRVVMDEKSVNRRLRHATSAILRENETDGSGSELVEYELIPPQWNGSDNGVMMQAGIPSNVEAGSSSSTRDELHHQEERFSTGLQLLQNDVVALCIRAGVPVQTLWPAEALLLNLNALMMHCRRQIESSSAIGALLDGT